MAEVVETQVLVLGLGAVGAAVAYQLSRRGAPFIGLEQQPPPPYARGSSQGETRITREAVGEGLDYAPLVRRSHAIWDDLEAAGAPPLRKRCGVLYLAFGAGGGQRHGVDAFLDATRRVGEQAGVRLEPLDAAAIRARFPQFEIPDGTTGYFEPDAGYVWPERCIQAQLDAVADRTQLRFEETVQAISQVGERVHVRTDKALYAADRAVVTLGAWIPDLIGEPFARDMAVLRQTLHWFAPDQPALWADAPVFLWFHGEGDADVFYGFPQTEGGVAGVKVATEQYALETPPGAMDETVTAAESAAMFADHVAGRLRGVSPERVAAKACLYTFNRRAGEVGRFVIGPARQAPRALVVSACSGHGFKHSAGLGEALVQQLVGEPGIDLATFAPTSSREA